MNFNAVLTGLCGAPLVFPFNRFDNRSFRCI